MQSEVIDQADFGLAPTHGDRLKVALFSNQFGDATGHGLSRYSRELFHALKASGNADVTPVAGWSSMAPNDLARLQNSTGFRLTGLGRRGTSLLWTFLNLPTLETCLKLSVDVVHATALGYPVATRRPLVVTIHDLGPLTQPQFFSATRPWVMQRSLDQAVAKASHIVCVSQSTADEVKNFVVSDISDRIRVVHEGVSPEFFADPPADALVRFNLPDDVPFIMSAGKLSPRKNLQGLLRAMQHLRDEIPHRLVLVGAAGWDTDVFQNALAESGLTDRVSVLGFVSDIELRALYRAASVYVQPSLYEGFGLPVLEAMASGAPVIASNSSSLPEVAGGAAVLSDTTDPEALAHDIRRVCQSSKMRADMRERGRERASDFTWEKCARSMMEIYDEARTQS